MNTQYLPKHLVQSLLVVVLVFTGLSSRASALVLDEENRRQVVLTGGGTVILIGEATNSPSTKSKRYYYLPFNLRLSSRPDSTPEFLFLKFTTDARGGASGGLMHFLMEWGPTPAQEAEIKTKLKADDPSAELVGPVPMTADGDSGSFKIISASLEDRTLAPTVVNSGKAPLVPGGKVAAATRLTADGAQLLAASFERARSITDLSIALNFNYSTLAPAVHGTIDIDWSKFEREKETIRAEYKRKKSGTNKTEDCFLFFCASSSRPEYTYSRDEMREQYSFLQEKQIVVVRFDQLAAVPDEKIAKVREAFFQFFLNMLAQPADQQNPPPPAPAASPDDKKKLDIEKGNGYRYNFSSIRRNIQNKTQHLELNYRLTFLNPFQIVGNMASWYNGVRDNPKCVASVNLNDPFFQHRDINFILDGDVKDIFEEAVNYVTLNVRKRRSAGRAFEDRLTMDAKYVKEKGINGVLTYARGEDRDPDTYEYQAQWSLRGGRVYPANPPWEKGNWEGQTLALPLVLRTIQFEGDIEGMKASDITRITAQIHYRKFGEEVEENISVSPAENKPMVDKRILMDKNARGFAYRLIIYHKTEGRLALPWAPQSDTYIYASIAPELLKTPSLKDAAKEAAKSLTSSTSEKVLERFSELVGERP